MSTVLLAQAHRYPKACLLPAVRTVVERAGGRCRTRLVDSGLELEIYGEEAPAEDVASVVIDWYLSWRAGWSRRGLDADRA